MPGRVALTFDMHPGDPDKGHELASQWTAKIFYVNGTTKTLFEVLAMHKARATFMVQNFPFVLEDDDWTALMKKIVDEGHEIGCHTIGHVKWGSLKDPKQPEGPKWNDPWDYFWDQIYPNYQGYAKLRTDEDLNIPAVSRSFAYPYTKSGQAIDDVIIQYYSHLRGCPTASCWGDTQGLMSEEKTKTTATVAGAWLDRSASQYWGAYSTYWLPKIFTGGEFMTFASHLPDWSNDPFSAAPWYIEYVLGYVNADGREIIIPMGELPSNFGAPQEMAAIGKGPLNIAPVKEPPTNIVIGR